MASYSNQSAIWANAYQDWVCDVNGLDQANVSLTCQTSGYNCIGVKILSMLIYQYQFLYSCSYDLVMIEGVVAVEWFWQMLSYSTCIINILFYHYLVNAIVAYLFILYIPFSLICHLVFFPCFVAATACGARHKSCSIFIITPYQSQGHYTQ